MLAGTAKGVVMALKEGWKGRYFEDFEVGDVYRHGFGRTITETDNIWFTLLTMNTNHLHFNAHLAERSPWGKPLVNSGLTVAIVLGLSVPDVSQNGFANLSWDEIRLPNPVFIGDTLYAESLVTDLRESKSRPYVGIVSVKTRGLKQDGTIVVTWKRSVMVYRRDAPMDKDIFPEAATPIDAE
jgi:acyl dehydratase